MFPYVRPSAAWSCGSLLFMLKSHKKQRTKRKVTVFVSQTRQMKINTNGYGNSSNSRKRNWTKARKNCGTTVKAISWIRKKAVPNSVS